MVSTDLLQNVRHIILTAGAALEIRQIAEELEKTTPERYDDSIVREAVWVLIDRGEVDLTRDRKFISVKEIA